MISLKISDLGKENYLASDWLFIKDFSTLPDHWFIS